MNDERMLRKAIESNPDEATPRLMLADFLIERGRDEEAEPWRRLPHRNSPFASLVGRTVLAVWLGDDTLTLETDAGPLTYTAQGDCCSNSWFYRVLRADRLVGSPVLAVAEGRTDDVDPSDGLGRQEDDSVYGYCLLTAKGACEVTFRNSSNGYYGGWLDVSDAPAPDGCAQVTDSWQHPPAERKMGCGTGPGCACGNCDLIPGG